jgi:hybrid cluster-associated redox disulfide protein
VQMDAPFIQSRLTVEDVLKNWPEAFSVFIHRNTNCVGCLLQRFCTLEDVAEIYQISLQELTKDLEECVKNNNNQRSSL